MIDSKVNGVQLGFQSYSFVICGEKSSQSPSPSAPMALIASSIGSTNRLRETSVYSPLILRPNPIFF